MKTYREQWERGIKLNNIWSLNGHKPFEAFVNFYKPTNRRKPRIKEFFSIVWKSYKISSDGKMSIFSQVDKLKAMEWYISNSFNIGELSTFQKDISSNNYAHLLRKHETALNDVFFPLHNFRELLGKNDDKIFKKILYEKKNYRMEKIVRVLKKTNINKKKMEASKKDIDGNIKLTEEEQNLVFERIEHEKNLEKQKLIEDEQNRKEEADHKREDVLDGLLKPEDVNKENGEEFDGNGVERDYKVDSDDDSKDNKETEEEKKKRKKEKKEKKKQKKKEELQRKKTIKEEEKRRLLEQEDFRELDIDSVLGSKEDEETKDELDIGLSNLDRENMFKKELKNPEDRNKKKKSKNVLKRFKRITKNKLKFGKVLFPISDIFKIYFFTPWDIAYMSLINYYGERLALYFKFTTFYSNMLIPMAIIAIPPYVIDLLNFYLQAATGDLIDTIHTFIFIALGLIIMGWSLFFTWIWGLKEKKFLIETGFEETLGKKARLDFKNYKYKRSLTDDFVNSKQPHYTKIYSKLILAMFITLVCYGVSFGASLGIFYLKSVTVNSLNDENWIFLNQNIANVIEVLKIIFFEYIFYFIAIRLVLFVDPKYVSEFDQFLIMIVMLFNFLNNFGIIAFIMFIKPQIGSGFLQCAETGLSTNNTLSRKNLCLVEAEIFYKLFVAFKFITTFFRFLISTVKRITLKKTLKQHKKDIKRQNAKRKKSENYRINDITKRLFFQNPDDFENEALTVDDFTYDNVNMAVEKQIFLEISNDSDDFDTTLKHYSEIVILFTTLAWFGLLFPLSFFLVYISLILEMIIDKNDYFYFMRRPSPHGKAALGFWNTILNLVSSFAILTNCYTLAHVYDNTSAGIDFTNNTTKNIFFAGLIVFGFSVRFIFSNMLGGDPPEMKMLKSRQKYIKDRIIANQKGGQDDGETTAKIKSSLNPWGEIDYEYYEKLRERKKKAILQENY